VQAFIMTTLCILASAYLCQGVSKETPSIGPAFYWIMGLLTGMVNIIIFNWLS